MIPSKEQFIELSPALTNDAEFFRATLLYKLGLIQERREFETSPRRTARWRELSAEVPRIFNMPEPPEEEVTMSATAIAREALRSLDESGKLLEFVTPNNIARFIKPDVDFYLQDCETSENLPAWKWLHSQQNFIRAKNRAFKKPGVHERAGSDLIELFSAHIPDRLNVLIKDRGALLAGGTTSHNNQFNKWLIEHSPRRILAELITSTAISAARHRRWVGGVAQALANYHYGEATDTVVQRKQNVEGLISSWESFCKMVRVTRFDPEVDEYLNFHIKKIERDRQLMQLRALHESGTLYFIGRKDETVLERLFVREITLLHRKIFSSVVPAGLIGDLFYLDGMKSSLSERNISRISRRTLADLEKKNEVERDIRELLRQKNGY